MYSIATDVGLLTLLHSSVRMNVPFDMRVGQVSPDPILIAFIEKHQAYVGDEEAMALNNHKKAARSFLQSRRNPKTNSKVPGPAESKGSCMRGLPDK